MKRLIILLLVSVLFVGFSFSAVKTIQVQAPDLSRLPAYFRVAMYQLLEWVGDDFDANWDSIRVLDAQGAAIPFQVDDVDGNAKLSSPDILSFLFHGSATMEISDDWDILAVSYPPVLTVEEEENAWWVSGPGWISKVKVDDHGFGNFVGQAGKEGNLFGELGILRVAGWKGSTFWVDGNLGNRHEEKVSYNFNVNSVKMVGNGPVGVTFYAELESDTFIGLHQKVYTHVLKTGEVFVQSQAEFETYADLMKLQLMATKPLTDVDPDGAVHVLPLFRRMVWAEQINARPFDYWMERDAVRVIAGKPYVVIPANDPVRPLWWGATYIFASEEEWRANYSQALQVGVYEILDHKPLVRSDFEDFVMGNTWVYESREFRDGLFRWIPGEFEAFDATKGIVSTTMEDWPEHFKAGDVVKFQRLYGVAPANSLVNLVPFLERRSTEMQSIQVTY